MEKLFITKNKINVFSYHMPNLHGFCLTLNIKAGKLYEETIGITHLLEHMFFRRLDNLSQTELYQKLGKYGFYLNGNTYQEFLRFELTGNIKYFREACDIFCKLLAPVTFNTEDLASEKKRICRELEEHDTTTVGYIANKLVWKGTVLAKPPATPADIRRISLKKLKEEREKIFTADNMFFYVTGNVSEEDLNFLYHKIEQYPIKPSVNLRNNTVEQPAAFFNRQPDIGIKKSYYNYVSFSFDYDANQYGAHEIDILYDLLFEGNSAIFYYDLSEQKGLIYDFASYIERYGNIGRLYFSYEIAKDDLFDSIRATVNVLHGMKQNISDIDFERVQLNYVDNTLLLDDAEELNWQYAYDNHVLSYQYKSLDDYGALYKKVPKERIKAMAQDIFRLENLTVAIRAEKNIVHDVLKESLSKL